MQEFAMKTALAAMVLLCSLWTVAQTASTAASQPATAAATPNLNTILADLQRVAQAATSLETKPKQGTAPAQSAQTSKGPKKIVVDDTTPSKKKTTKKKSAPPS